MFFVSNTTISVLGDYTTTNEWGDEIDADVYIATGITASITEVGQKSQSEVSLTPFVLTEGILRVAPTYLEANGGPISQNCRIKDEKTDTTWIIMSISAPQNALGHFPYRINLQKVS